MADIQLNTDLPANYRTPGVYTSLILGDPGAPAPSNRALLIGIMCSGGIATPNTPFLGLSRSGVGAQGQAVGGRHRRERFHSPSLRTGSSDSRSAWDDGWEDHWPGSVIQPSKMDTLLRC